jgi:hypothetical protein
MLPPEGEQEVKSLPATSSSEKPVKSRSMEREEEFQKTYRPGHILLLLSKMADAASSTSCPNSVQHVINGAKNVVGDSIGDGRAEIKSAENSVSRNGSATQQECLNTNSNLPSLPTASFSKPSATPSVNGHLCVPLSHSLPN